MVGRPIATLLIASLVAAGALTAVGPVGVGAAGNVPTTVDTATGEDDWPTLGTDERNSGNASTVTGPTSQLRTHWSADVDTRYESSPVVTGGTVYVANHTGALVARDADTGTLQWTRHGSFHAHGTAPAVTDRVVYATNGSSVEAIDADTGDRYWAYETGGTASSSPAVVDGTVYVGADDGTVYALDAVSGTQTWSVATASGVAPSPAVADGTVYVNGGDQTVYALDAADGTESWSYSVNGDPTPPAVGDGRVYVGTGTYPGTLYALDTADGSETWSYDLPSGSILGSPAVADGSVYVGDSRDSRSDLWRFDASTGTVEWRKDVEGIWAKPAIGEEAVYVTAGSGNLYGYDRETGTETVGYNLASGTNMWSSPALVDGTVYAGVGASAAGRGGLYAVTEAPVARATASPGTVRTGEAVSLDATASSDSSLGTIRSYEWDTDADGATEQTGRQVTESFDHGGSYPVMLTVTDDRGVTNSTRVTVHVANASRGPVLDAWPTVGHDAGRTGNVTATGVVDGVRRRLHQPVSATGALVIAEDTVFLPTDHGLNATNASTGAAEWADGSVGGKPTYADGTVYVGNDSGGITGFDASTGTRTWGAATTREVIGVPAVANGTVYATTFDALRPGSFGVTAWDASTGTQRWQYETGVRITGPSVSDGRVVVGTENGFLVAVEGGTKQWNVSVGSLVQHVPTIVGGTVYTGTFEGHVTARSLETGTETWNRSVGRIVEGSVAVADGTVYVGDGDEVLSALDADTGATEFQKTLPGPIVTDPVVVNGTVYVGAGDAIYGYDADSGTRTWSVSTPNQRLSSLAVVGDRLYTIGSTESGTSNLTAYEGTADTGPTAVAEASSTTASTGDTVTFDARNATDDVGVRRVRWDFDDGETATGTRAAHSFDASGTYDVTATVTDGAGYRASETVTVSVTSSGGEGANVQNVDLGLDTETPDQPSTPRGTATEKTSTPDAGTDTSATSTGERSTTSDATRTTGEDGPGFGVPEVVAAALFCLLVARWRAPP